MDTSKDGVLSLEEFLGFFRKLSWRPEIERIFKNYCDEDFKIDETELVRFFNQEMSKEISKKYADELIQEYEPDPSYKDSNFMSYYGFLYLLISPHADVFDMKYSKTYQDMSHPLSHYYIASSHNTYLVGNQLTDKSSVESYVKALEHGCRCVELDCWDGDDEEPIIYHGYTLTSKINLKIVLKAIDEYAFKKSDYPVILSIENHCSVTQQTKMAAYIKEIFGEKLLLQKCSESETELPSPQQLKGKILIKGKKLALQTEHGEDEVSDEDEAADLDDEDVKEKARSSKKTKIKLSEELSACVVYLQSRGFKGVADSSTTYEHISSLNETKAGDLCEQEAPGFSKRNQWQLVRIYPNGTRTNSSNYSPLKYWTSGCQIVALNYQTKDKPMHQNRAKFRDNGGCGYLLKPSYLRKSTFDPLNINDKSAVDVTIRIISAQQLPKPHKKQRGEVVDPFVKISINGCKQDKQSHRTSTVKNNGFNPTWTDEEFKIHIKAPELAIVTFSVYDKDGNNHKEKLGLYSLPANCLGTGYRHVHLEDISGNSLEPASIFIKISFA